jgi:AbrB family looped-hinge helix DNA binding protein
METILTKMSSRGQVVIPQGIREDMGLTEGTPFVVSRKQNIIFLRAMDVPDVEKELGRILSWGHQYAKEKGIKPEDVQKAIDKRRG